MTRLRRPEAPEERRQRLMRETQAKRDEVARDDIAVARMITQNIKLHGP